MQHEPDLEGHAAPGGEDVPAETPQRSGLEDQRSGPPRYDWCPAAAGVSGTTAQHSHLYLLSTMSAK